jgi:short-subunit dehydrogenase
MSPLYESLDAVSEELFDKTLAVNLKGPFRLAALAATHMAAHDGGSIINIGTTASLTASVGELPYACAKAGLNALTVGLAEVSCRCAMAWLTFGQRPVSTLWSMAGRRAPGQRSRVGAPGAGRGKQGDDLQTTGVQD